MMELGFLTARRGSAGEVNQQDIGWLVSDNLATVEQVFLVSMRWISLDVSTGRPHIRKASRRRCLGHRSKRLKSSGGGVQLQ